MIKNRIWTHFTSDYRFNIQLHTDHIPFVFGSSFLIRTMSISFWIKMCTCWQHRTGFLTKSIAALMLSAFPGFICSLSSRVKSLSCCNSSWSRVFTLQQHSIAPYRMPNDKASWKCGNGRTYIFWYLLLSQSLSKRPLVLALLTICTNMGVNSPSNASKPFAKAAAVIWTLPSSLA